MNAFTKLALSAALALGLAACGKQAENTTAPSVSDASGANAVAENKTEIRFGTTPGDFADMIKEQIQPMLEKEGYKVTLTEFPDYVTPNKALAEGSIDMNVFQHKPYLDSFKEENKLDLTEIFQVPTAPLGLYPGKLSSLDQVKDGSSISVPNDPSNFARALVMMKELGWLKLKDGIDPLKASKADIAENTKNIQLVEMEAANLPRSRQDVDFAIVNGNYAMSSGMKLTEALFQEPSFAYINWAAVRTADKDTKWVKDVAAAYASDEFKKYAHTRFAGYKYPAAWNENGSASAPAASDTHTNNTALAADKAAVNVENGVVKFYFASGKSAIAENADKAVTEAIAAAKAGKKLIVSGYADSTGNAEANAKLSKQRAEAVRDFLVKQGVAASAIELRKPENSVQGSNTESRRVEVKIEG